MFNKDKLFLNLDNYYCNNSYYQDLYNHISLLYSTNYHTRYKLDTISDIIFLTDLLLNLIYRSFFLKSKYILFSLKTNYYTDSFIKEHYPHLDAYKQKYNLSVRRIERCITFLAEQNIAYIKKGGREHKLYPGNDPKILEGIKGCDQNYKATKDGILYCSRAALSKLIMNPITEWSWVKDLHGWDLIRTIINLYKFPQKESEKETVSKYNHRLLKKYNGVLCVDKYRDTYGFPLPDRRAIKSHRIKKLTYRSNEDEEQTIAFINEAINQSILIPDDLKWFFIYTRHFGIDSNYNGRFYSCFNRIDKKYRQLILNTLKYVEIDMKNTNLNILWKYATGNYYKDSHTTDFYADLIKWVYDFRKLADEQVTALRPLYKLMMLSVLGSTNERSYKLAIRKTLIDNGCIEPKGGKILVSSKEVKWKMYLKKYNLDISSRYPRIPLALIDAGIITFCKPILNYLWNDATPLCMNIESRMMERLMFESIKDGNLPLSIHDCICVPDDQQHIEKYEKLMWSTLTEVIACKKSKTSKELIIKGENDENQGSLESRWNRKL